jgi:hypothetical protein
MVLVVQMVHWFSRITGSGSSQVQMVAIGGLSVQLDHQF